MSDRAPSDCLQRSWMLRNIHEQKGSRRYCVHLGRLVLFAHFKIDKRNPTAFAIAEVTESELEDDNLGLEQFLDSEFDGVDGGHEASAVLHFPGRNCRNSKP